MKQDRRTPKGLLFVRDDTAVNGSKNINANKKGIRLANLSRAGQAYQAPLSVAC